MKIEQARVLRYPRPEQKAKPLTKPAPLPNKIQPQQPLKGGLGNSRPLFSPNLSPQKKTGQSQIFKQLALDTETTGSDLWHGCRPFFISTCDEDGHLRYWEWDVNPLNREVIVPAADLKELEQLIQQHHFILHNTKFDVRALETLGLPRLNLSTCQDTLIASHCLVSNESHKLKDLGLMYLNIDDNDQQDLREATNEARAIGRALGWGIAKDGGHKHFPAQRKSPKEGWWVFDTWLPRAVAKHERYLPTHPWWSVLRDYALRDAERTYGLWWLQLDAMEQERLIEQYEERRRLLEPLYEMEHQGVTVSRRRLTALSNKLSKESVQMQERCYEIADYKIDNLDSSRQIEGVLFGNFKIKPGKRTKGAIENGANHKGQQYAVSNDVLLKLLDRTTAEHHEFIWKLIGYRAREKSKDYLEEYALRGRPCGTGWITLHTSFNATGTDTTRLSASGPNMQNVGKGGKRKDDPIPSLRSIFGPKPGREWYSIDYSNIEMRIFAYKSGDPQLIAAFESGYSVHLIFAEILYEEQWAECKAEVLPKLTKDDPEFKKAWDKAWQRVSSIQSIEAKLPAEMREKLRRATGKLFKNKFEATYYQWVKNGNFALIYGAGRERADTTYHRSGAYDLIRKMLPKVDQFMKLKDHEARTYGFVTLDSGYRLFVPPQEPHVAVNYYVQGDAGWCMIRAINRVHRYLKSLNEEIRRGGKKMGDPTYRMTMTIHDELDFDFPKHARNTEVIRKIGKIMAEQGESIGVPTPVEIERHADNWSEVTEAIAV